MNHRKQYGGYEPLAFLCLVIFVIDGVMAGTALAGADVGAVNKASSSSLWTDDIIPLATCTPTASIVPSPDFTASHDHLKSVTATSADDVWAVGYGAGVDGGTLIDHWDGTQWSITPGSVAGLLSGVSALSADDAWAVGLQGGSTLVLHRDGTSWGWTPSPNPGSYANQLLAVKAISASDVWAVGFSSDGSHESFLTIHWDGSQWNNVVVPDFGQSAGILYGVSASGSADVWAVGVYCCGTESNYLTATLHWDGSIWSHVASPTPGTSDDHNYLYAVDSISADDAWAVGYYSDTASPHQALVIHWDGTQWSQVESPDDANKDLRSLSAVSSGDIWAVGYDGSGGSSGILVEHWDGTQWVIVPSPNVPGSTSNQLLGVAALNGQDIWAVGEFEDINGTHTLTIHYGGDCQTPTVIPATATPDCGLSWRVVSSPNHEGTFNNLTDVAVIAPNDIWAVGYYEVLNGDNTFTIHWDGAQWNTIDSPNTADYTNVLRAVTAVASNDVWAVGEHGLIVDYGEGLILHWDGTSWGIVAAPETTPPLADVAAISGNDVWAVGGIVATGTIHWDGTQWNTVPSPNPLDYENVLLGVAAIASNDLWAAGISYDGGCCAGQTLTMRWDGTQWNAVASPNLGGYSSVLEGVDAVASDDVWAVGEGDELSGDQDRTLVEHWDGSVWTIIASPSPGVTHNFLHRVHALSATDIWAVGEYTGSSVYGTMILHWDGSAWSVSSSPSPGSAGNGLHGIAVASATDVWAVGYQDPGGTLVLRYSNVCTSTTPTITSSPTQVPTSATTATSAPTQTPTAPATFTSTSTSTSTPAFTSTPTWTQSATGTSTPTIPAITSTPTPTACAIQFTDVREGSTFYNYIKCMACMGIISGYSEGCETGNPCFRPQTNVTRGQLSKIVSLAAGFSEEHTNQTFTDVAIGSTFYQYVERMASRGIIGGYACGGVGEPCDEEHRAYFRPNSNATRGQIAKIDVLAAVEAVGWTLKNPPTNTFEDVAVGSTFYEYVETAYSHNVLGGYACSTPPAGECVPPTNKPYFLPNNNATRGQTSKIVANSFFPGCSFGGGGSGRSRP